MRAGTDTAAEAGHGVVAVAVSRYCVGAAPLHALWRGARRARVLLRYAVRRYCVGAAPLHALLRGARRAAQGRYP